MSKEEELQLLFAKLNSYLTNDDKKYDTTQMINSIISSIVQYLDCNYSKLIQALENFKFMKDNNWSVRFSDDNNLFDISGGAKISVKGFMSKGKPMLFFYIDNEQNPYLAVKTDSNGKKDLYSVEVSSNPKGSFKSKYINSKINENYFAILEEFEFFAEKCKSTKILHAHASSNQSDAIQSKLYIQNLDQEYKSFFDLLNNSVGQEIDFSKISEYGLDVLFLSFYESIKLVSKDCPELPLKDLIILINETLYNNSQTNVNSDVVSKVVNLEQSEDFSSKKRSFVINFEGKVLKYDVVKSEKYLSIEVFENDKKLNSAMIVGSGNGFSFVRTNYSDNTKKDDSVSSFVINFSNNKLKYMTIGENGNKSNGRDLQMSLSFNEDGSVNLHTSDSLISTNKLESKNIKINDLISTITMG